MIIIFEGPDGGGKDFIREAFEDATKYEHTVVTRFFFSQIVYARYFNRPEWNVASKRNQLEFNLKKFLLEFKPLVVYCHADSLVLAERILRRGENPDKQPDSFGVMSLYHQIFQDYKVEKRLLEIDTSLEPAMEDTVKRIIGKINSLETKRRN